MASVQKLPDRLYDFLRQQIVAHEIAPGQAIRQDVLARELGTSKIPLREALARLEAGGLVRSVLNRGFIAAPLSANEAGDIFSLRLLIEPPTAAVAAVEASPAQRDSVKERVNARRSIILALLDQDAHPSRRNIVANLFDRSERYHLQGGPEALFDTKGLQTLVSCWLAGDGEGTRAAYAARLSKWEGLAMAALVDNSNAK